MDKLSYIKFMSQLTNRFYEEVASSFSQTRSNAWSGWSYLTSQLEEKDNLSVLDVAAGNLRFARYLASCLPHATIDYTALDTCTALLSEKKDFYREDTYVTVKHAGAKHASVKHATVKLTTRSCDLIEAALAYELPLASQKTFDLVVVFGFMHHIPTQDLRAQFIKLLMGRVKPGGVLALSFWHFMDDERIARRANMTTLQACQGLPFDEVDLQTNDYLLGWKNVPGVYRYCHNFTEEEINELIAASVELSSMSQVCFEGEKNDRLNTYILLKKHSY